MNTAEDDNAATSSSRSHTDQPSISHATQLQAAEGEAESSSTTSLLEMNTGEGSATTSSSHATSSSSHSPHPDQPSTYHATQAADDRAESGPSTSLLEMNTGEGSASTSSSHAISSSSHSHPDQPSTSHATQAAEGGAESSTSTSLLETNTGEGSATTSSSHATSSSSHSPHPDQPSTSHATQADHIGPYAAETGLTAASVIEGATLPANFNLKNGLVLELASYLQEKENCNISQVGSVLLQLKQNDVTTVKQIVAYIRALQKKVKSIKRNGKGEVRDRKLNDLKESEFLLIRERPIRDETPRKRRLRRALDAEKAQHRAAVKKLKMTEKEVEILAAREEMSSMELSFLKEEVAEHEATSTRMTAEMKSKEEDVQNMTQAVDEISAKLTKLQDRHEEVLSSLANLQEKFNPLEDELSSYKVICEETNEKLAALEKEMGTSRTKLASLSTRNVNKRIKRRDHEIQKLKEERRKSDAIVNDLREELELTKAQLQATKATYDKLTSTHKAKISLQRKLRYQKKKHHANQLNTSEEDYEYEKRIETLKQKVEELNGCLSLCEDECVVTFENGRYTNTIRELIMELLTMNVSMNKIAEVIKSTITKLTPLEIGRLPSKATISRLITEAKILADLEVGLAMSKSQPEDALGNVIHGDGTTKFHKKYQNYQVTLPDGSSRTMGVMEMGRGDTTAVVESFKHKIQELANELSAATQNTDSSSVYRNLIASISATMTDQGATMPQFNDQLKMIREEILPIAVENWDTLPQDAKNTMLEFGRFFCKMHPLINFADEVNKTLKSFEDIATSGKNPHTIISSEAGVTRLVRTASKAFNHRGCDKSGVEDAFSVYVENEYNECNHVVQYVGNRANILFEGAATVYFHKTHIRNFVSLLPDANQLLKAVLEDVNEKIHVAELKALGLVHKLITEPLWTKIKTAENILALNATLHELQKKLIVWRENPQDLINGESSFDDTTVNKDFLYDALMLPTDDHDIDSMCIQALQLICCSILLILERQCRDNLPGGKYWDPDAATQERFANVPTTNLIGERDFGYLDLLVRQKPSARTITLEALIMWSNNQTVQWLNSLDPSTKDKYMDLARRLGPEIINKYQDRMKEIKKERWMALQSKQKAKQEKEEKALAERVKQTDDVAKQGGVWVTEARVRTEFDTMKEAMTEEKVRRELQKQLLFHQRVLKSKAPQKEFFQLSTTVDGKRKQFSKEEMKEHLIAIIKHNKLHEIPTEAEEDHQSTSAVHYETADIRNKKFEEKRQEIISKLENERKKRAVQDSKLHLENLTSNPHLLISKHVQQKCINPSGHAQWYNGTVTAMDVPNGMNTTFTISYDEDALEADEDISLNFPLLKDLKNNDLIILDKLA